MKLETKVCEVSSTKVTTKSRARAVFELFEFRIYTCGIGSATKERTPLAGKGIMNEAVFPGQDLRPFIEDKLSPSSNAENIVKIQVGPGIIRNSDEIISLQAGKLQNRKQGSKFNLIFSQKRYVPLQNDLVIGIVAARLSEFFRVDIGAQSMAVLPLLNGFEGSTKKNKPTWNVGTLIFARVSLAHPDLEPELSCFDPSGRIAVDLFGELGSNENPTLSEDIKLKSSIKTSNLLRTSCNYSKKMQNPMKESLLIALGKYFAFEIAAGSNGRIFLQTGNPQETAALSRIIKSADDLHISEVEIETAVYKLATSLGKLKTK